ncbi:MAG: carboxypeptidase regulatory-like domain-containing protein, partial [Bryobacteraceae bacterium]
MKIVCLWAALAAMLCAQTGSVETGVVKSDGQPIPGATVRATQGAVVLQTLTDATGRYRLERLAGGTWTIDVQMFGFNPIKKEVTVPETGSGTADFTLELRMFQGRPGGPGGPGRPGLPAVGEEGAGDQRQDLESQIQSAINTGPPPDASVNAEGANESFLLNGSLSRGVQTSDADMRGFGGPGGGFGPGGMSPDEMRQRGQAGGGFGGGPGGFGGGPGGGGPGGGGPGGGGFGGGGGGGGRGGGGGGGGGGVGRQRGQRPGAPDFIIGNRARRGQDGYHGALSYTFRNSALDARPYSLNGDLLPKASYAQNGINAAVGGALKIPKIYTGDKTFFFFNYSGNLARNPFNQTTTVPLDSERLGVFDVSRGVIFDPLTNLPFANNTIPVTRISPIARGLLQYFPSANQPGSVQNYQILDSVSQNAQNINVRINHTLTKKDRLAFSLGYQHRTGENQQVFGFRDETGGSGVNADVSWTHTLGRRNFQTLRVTFNRNRSQTTPFFAYKTDVAGQLGINGAATDAINWGPPNLSFTNYGSLSDASAILSRVQTFGINESVSFTKGKHNLSVGGQFSRLHVDNQTDTNARGSFSFSGIATSSGAAQTGTGYDFADFLLGLAQTSSVRFGGTSTYMRGVTFAAFGQDDWRVKRNLTINLGLRYELFPPLHEKYGHIANLDVAPGFTAVSPVLPGQAAPYSGSLPDALIRSDKNNLAPRVAMAWKPKAEKSTVVKIGYGWYYNGGVFQGFAAKLAGQPPFATTTTLTAGVDTPSLTLANGLATSPVNKTVLNTFAVDVNYLVGYAQTWNVSVQTNLPAQLVMEVGYLGTKGTRLDIQRLPNRAAQQLATSTDNRSISNAVGFTYDSPEGNSIYHAGQARLTRRFRKGISFNMLYIFAKSIDNSSTLGGAGNTVAQNDLNLAAERGLSSFDRRHTLTSNFVVTSPFGNNSTILAGHDKVVKFLKDWTLNGGLTANSGGPFTARILGNRSNTGGSGAIGSGRADATGLPVDAGGGYFNLLAFTVPAANA